MENSPYYNPYAVPPALPPRPPLTMDLPSPSSPLPPALLQTLPYEMLHHVFSFFQPQHIFLLLSVSKSLPFDPSFWDRLWRDLYLIKTLDGYSTRLSYVTPRGARFSPLAAHVHKTFGPTIYRSEISAQEYIERLLSQMPPTTAELVEKLRFDAASRVLAGPFQENLASKDAFAVLTVGKVKETYGRPPEIPDSRFRNILNVVKAKTGAVMDRVTPFGTDLSRNEVPGPIEQLENLGLIKKREVKNYLLNEKRSKELIEKEEAEENARFIILVAAGFERDLNGKTTKVDLYPKLFKGVHVVVIERDWIGGLPHGLPWVHF